MKVPIACTLVGGDVPQRISDWKDALTAVNARQPIAGGVRLELCSDAPVARIAELAVAEQQCCAFFEFALTVDSRGVALEVTGPDDAAAVVEELFGAAASV